jgi:UDP-N-acetylmuramate dehydrogenase
VVRRENWEVERFQYEYRNSVLKGQPDMAVVLAARLRLSHSTPETVKERTDELAEIRRGAQPPGASMGSMFKNPPGDYAGRLIEAAGLKGTRVGGAEISWKHANFLVNLGGASASDIYRLIQKAQQVVEMKFGVHLELEIILIGDWLDAQEAAREKLT